MILYDICLFSAQFRYEIISIWDLKSHVKVVVRCETCKFKNGAETLVFKALTFQEVGNCRKFPGGEVYVIADLISDLWR
jgi:hypothetical protein